MIANRAKNFQESIFATMSALALKHQAINLSQGFPDFDGPDWLKNLAINAIKQGRNQYAPYTGIPFMRQNLKTMAQKYYGLNYDSESEITVTHGATQAIYLSLQALINPGDEVLLFEPFYDSYLASVHLAQGVPKVVTLSWPEFEIPWDQLEETVSARTKLLILNNPHNPSGKLFTKEDLLRLSHFVEKHNLLVLSDEVYEFLVFDRLKYTSFASLPEMKDRTIRISSAGKTFGMTGWKIGWVMANEEITHAIRMLLQFNTFSINHPCQYACGRALESLESYIPEFQQTYQEKRDLLYAGLLSKGFEVHKSQGSYFLMAKFDSDLSDIEYAQKMIVEKGVAPIPPSVFYLNSTEGQDLLRFSFAKQNSVLQQALERL